MKYRVKMNVEAGALKHSRDEVVECASVEAAMDILFNTAPEPPKEIKSFKLSVSIEPVK